MKKTNRRRGEKPLRLCKKRQGKKRCSSAAFAKRPLRSRPESTLKAPHRRICNVQMPYVLRETKRPRLYGKVALPKRAFPLPCCRKSTRTLTPQKPQTIPLPERKAFARSPLVLRFSCRRQKTPPQKRGRCKGFLLSRLAAILPEKGVDAERRNEKLFVTSGDG